MFLDLYNTGELLSAQFAIRGFTFSFNRGFMKVSLFVRYKILLVLTLVRTKSTVKRIFPDDRAT
jgi:hypothetical protein